MLLAHENFFHFFGGFSMVKIPFFQKVLNKWSSLTLKALTPREFQRKPSRKHRQSGRAVH